tara:strand:+ start:84 stop:203 length:120 start_codon:yes stop_codon:yes gene_type:complete
MLIGEMEAERGQSLCLGIEIKGISEITYINTVEQVILKL